MYGVTESLFKSWVNITSVYRVHWLQVRAQFHHWLEELTLKKNEIIEWTIQFFFKMAQEWDAHAPSLRNGQIAYGEHQKGMWQAMGKEVCKQFLKIWLGVHL